MSSLCARVRSAQGPVAGRSSVRPWTSVRTQPCRRTSALRAVEQRDGPTTAAGAASGSTTSGSRRSSSPESSAAISSQSSGSQSSGSQSSGSAEERRYMSLLPPFVSRATRLEELGEGLWALVQPLKLDWDAFDIQIRMTVARLPDGSLLLASPVAPTPECLRLLASLGGAVRHIVLPSAAPEHWCALACPAFAAGHAAPPPPPPRPAAASVGSSRSTHLPITARPLPPRNPLLQVVCAAAVGRLP